MREKNGRSLPSARDAIAAVTSNGEWRKQRDEQFLLK